MNQWDRQKKGNWVIHSIWILNCSERDLWKNSDSSQGKTTKHTSTKGKKSMMQLAVKVLRQTGKKNGPGMFICTERHERMPFYLTTNNNCAWNRKSEMEKPFRQRKVAAASCLS